MRLPARLVDAGPGRIDLPMPLPPKPNPPSELQALDARLTQAGLVRSGRHPSAAHAAADRPAEAAAAELCRPAPEPRFAANGIAWMPVPGWELPWLWGGFSTRLGGLSRAYCGDGAPGELNLGFTAGDSREAVLENRWLFLEAVTGDPSTPLATLRQFHSNLVVRAASADTCREKPRRADGLVSSEPGLLLGVQTADCIPVLVADRRRRVVGAFHAGWRGTVKRIVETGIGRMRLEFGSRPADLIAAIGPGIGACCYAVGEDVFSEFESQFPYARDLFREVFDADPVRLKYPLLFLSQRAPGHLNEGPRLHVDLAEANRRQLLAAGLKPKSIAVIGGCTQCNPDLFFSHRGSRGSAGRMMAVIGIRKRAISR